MYHLHHTGKASPDPSCYVFQLALSHSQDRIAASNSSHTIKLYSRVDLQFLGECTKNHRATIHDICWSPVSHDLLLSCDAEGAILMTDTRKPDSMKVDVQLHQPEQVFSLDLRRCGNVLAVGDGLDTVLFDLRKPKPELRRVAEFHTDDITQVRFHPKRSDILCTASEDGLVNVLDLTQQDEDEDLLQWVFNIENPVTKLTFYGDRCENIAAITTLETLTLNSLDNGETLGFVPRQTDDTYIVDCAYGRVYGKNELLVFSGSKEPAFLGAIAVQVAQATNLSPPVGLLNGGHTDLVRSVLCLDHAGALVTAGEDGVVCMWKPEPPPNTPDRAMRAHEASVVHPPATAMANAEAKPGKPGRKFKPY